MSARFAFTLMKTNDPSGKNGVGVHELPQPARPRLRRAGRHQGLHLAHLAVGDELPSRPLRHRRIKLPAYESFALIFGGGGGKRHAISVSAGNRLERINRDPPDFAAFKVARCAAAQIALTARGE